MKNELLKDLQWRGLLNDCTDLENLDAVLESDKISLYCGVDPTGDSLHVGHLLPQLVLRRFQNAGHKPIILVGGATGSIGDPSGKKQERQLQTLDVIAHNVACLKGQLEKIFDFNAENGAVMVNNYDWTSSLNVLDFLRDIGKNFNVNQMLAKDIVASRLDTGISFTEFSYQILQALDFNHLYENLNCKLQIGGSDQWGNIVAGLELIRKKQDEGAKAFGLTIPLVTKADGTKFGKTESGAVWLDAEKTSPYEMFQFFINTADTDAIKFLKYFTFLSKVEIEAIEEAFTAAPHERAAQKALAKEVVTFVHGEAAYEQALRISEALFSGSIENLSSEEIEVGFKDVPSTELTDELNLVDALIAIKAASSKRESREFISNNSISINGAKVADLEFLVSKTNAIGGKFTVVRRGKKKYFLIKHI
ncbi:MAG: tyrosine--tRNA ligase [Turicibacter sp.]|nr:tyrosine--tRNA ligase [Turicibacter sp.]